jgi:hypothetical protein
MQLRELASLPPGLQGDGELYAPGLDGTPDFHRLGARLLRGVQGVRVVYAVFDLRIPRFYAALLPGRFRERAESRRGSPFPGAPEPPM